MRLKGRISYIHLCSIFLQFYAQHVVASAVVLYHQLPVNQAFAGDSCVVVHNDVEICSHLFFFNDACRGASRYCRLAGCRHSKVGSKAAQGRAVVDRPIEGVLLA